MKKPIIILLALVLFVGGGVWYFVAYRLDSMIQNSIESSVSAALGTQVSVGTLKTDIKGGSLTIANVTIANPPGFRNKNAFSLTGITAAVDYENFDIKRVVIDKPEIVIEEIGGDTNFSRLMAGIEKSESEPDSDSDSDSEDEGKEEPIITIHHFRMNESRASFESESLDHYSDLKVRAVEVSNVKGTSAEVADVIAKEIINQIARAAAIELLKAKAAEKIDGLFKKDKD